MDLARVKNLDIKWEETNTLEISDLEILRTAKDLWGLNFVVTSYI
jgi:hypothetical protein